MAFNKALNRISTNKLVDDLIKEISGSAYKRRRNHSEVLAEAVKDYYLIGNIQLCY